MNTLTLYLYFLLLFTNSVFSMTMSEFMESISKNKVPNVEWATKVNEILPQEDASINVILGFRGYSYYYNGQITVPAITIHKKDLLELGSEKVNLIHSIQRTYIFSKKELLFFNELPDDLSNNLKPYFFAKRSGPDLFDYRIKFCYKKNITMHHLAKTIFSSYKQLLPITLTNLLYHHIYGGDIDNLWIKTQNPSLLELNQEKELTNKLIDKLQAQSIPGSKLLEKMIIDHVPFEYIIPAHLQDLYERNILFGCIIPAIIINAQLFYSTVYHSKYYETKNEFEGRVAPNVLLFIFCNGTLLFCPLINAALTEIIFSCGIPHGLAHIIALVTLYGIINRSYA